MLSSGHWQPDEDGEYFIDRNPKLFIHILDFLRTGKVNTKGFTEDDHLKLKEDLDYYLITIPPQTLSWSKEWTWSKEFCGSNIVIQDRIVTKQSGGSNWNAGVLGSIPNLSSFKLRLKNIVSHGCAMLGMAPKKNFNINGSNYTSCGWYYYAHTGGLYSSKGDGNRSYATALQVGSILEVIFNKEQKTISFSVDGIPKGLAYSNIAEDEIFPAIEIHDQGISIEILQ
uniref:Potassium channel tetramerisation-type BTB domain-containing protein n=1 Tax=Arcella intermedia TaxID=1963864 RepID=A0A6B2LF59_9EUKA